MNDSGQFPPGWDARWDSRSCRYYYINHFNKITTWEDPRPKAHTNGEYIPLQHGSPDLRRNHVHPANSYSSPMRAFQIPYTGRIKEMSQSSGSALSVRTITSRMAESSLNITAEDTEQLVRKIGAMFPTVSDVHIRLLLKKYHNREAVVMSALQIEKHPISTPGPYATPPVSIKTNIHYTRSASPARPGSVASSALTSELFRNNNSSPLRPYSSPKMKLRYMKGMFPSADETIILDVLANHDNNVQKTSEALVKMGYEKQDIAMRLQQQKQKEQKAKAEAHVEPPAVVIPRIKTAQEKAHIKEKLQQQYQTIAEQLISIALDSVNYDIERADKILKIVVDENSNVERVSTEHTARNSVDLTRNSDSTTPKFVQNHQNDNSDVAVQSTTTEKPSTFLHKKNYRSNVNDPSKWCKSESADTGYKSSYVTKPSGAYSDLAKGHNGDILLSDYVTWSGANAKLLSGKNEGLAKGPNKGLLQSRTYQPKGPNACNRKGPTFGLAKGSIYSQVHAVK